MLQTKKRMFGRAGPKVFERTLIYIPILHTEVDLGALRESVRRVTRIKLGQAALKRKEKVIDKMWTTIEQVIDDLDLSYEKVRLYQDGLPVCGGEVEIVKELSNNESRNHKLLLRLMERGATIMGTESTELLIEEYELFKKILASGDALEAAKNRALQKTLSNSLLQRRDQYIADRINRTLRIGEEGILFIGMLHSLEGLLDKDIQTIYPISRPFIHGGGENERNRSPDSNH